MQSALDWLAALPPALLYPVLAAIAAIENMVPPFPADVAVAFGAFVAAQGTHRMPFVFLSAWVGNVLGALLVYQLGRRYGAESLERRVAGKKADRNDARFRAMFERYGLPALFLARFVPGVRALVPAVAGALRVPLTATVLMLTAAAAIWYGLIVIVAFRVGANWERVQARLAGFSAAAGWTAGAVLAAGGIAWLVVRRRQSPR